VLAALLVAAVAGGQERLELLGPLDLGLHLAQLALELDQLLGQLRGLGVLRRALGGVGDDVDVVLGQLLVRRLIEVRELLGHLHAALPAHGGHLAHLVQVAGHRLRLVLGQEARELAGHLHPELVLELGDLLDHAQVGLALVLGNGGQHLAGHVHADVADGGAEGHGIASAAGTRTGWR
jgi:hypothetical protein